MTHKVTGGSKRSPAMSRSSTAITVGDLTPPSYYSGPRTEAYRCPPMRTIKMGGGKTARVLVSPKRGC